MDTWLDFLASVVDSVAWPFAVVWLVFLLREQIKEVIPRIRRFRVAGVEVDVSERIERLEEEAEAVDLPPPFEPTAPGPPTFDEAQLDEASFVAPRGVVLDSWLALEDEIGRAGERSDLDVRGRVSAPWLIRELHAQGFVSPEIRGMVEDMRALRNAAVHDSAFDTAPGPAIGYAKLSRRLVRALRGVAQSHSD